MSHRCVIYDFLQFKFSKGQIERLKSKFGVPSNLAEEIVYNLKGCPKDDTTEKCPKRSVTPPVIDTTIDVSETHFYFLHAFQFLQSVFAIHVRQVPWCEKSRTKKFFFKVS